MQNDAQVQSVAACESDSFGKEFGLSGLTGPAQRESPRGDADEFGLRKQHPGSVLREQIESGQEISPFIGIYDAFSATIAARHSPNLFYSGFGFAASHYGLPDLGYIAWRTLSKQPGAYAKYCQVKSCSWTLMTVLSIPRLPVT
jgi:hypothetical protein